MSPFGRQESIFAAEYGSTLERNNVILLLADALNSKKPTDLRNILTLYNKEASIAASGQMDLWSGVVPTPEEIMHRINKHFNKLTPDEKQKLVDQSRAESQRTAKDTVAERAEESPKNLDSIGRSGKAKASRQDNISEEDKIVHIDPRSIPEEEKERRGKMLCDAPAIDVAVGQIVATKELTARKAAEIWWNENVAEPAFYDTEVGEVEINKNSVQSSLAHKYGQMKLDAITSLIEGFENAVYIGTMPDFTRQDGVLNHYFAYPINYGGKRCYVFCRALQDTNMNRLYVHEVFVGDKIKKGDTLQTAASQPHGGISLYRDILANVLEKSASASSTDIETEPEGKRNGTATPQNGLVPADKGNAPSADKQANGEKRLTSISGNKAVSVAKKLGQKVNVVTCGRDIKDERTRKSFAQEYREELAKEAERSGDLQRASEIRFYNFMLNFGGATHNQGLCHN